MQLIRFVTVMTSTRQAESTETWSKNAISPKAWKRQSIVKNLSVSKKAKKVCAELLLLKVFEYKCIAICLTTQQEFSPGHRPQRNIVNVYDFALLHLSSLITLQKGLSQIIFFCIVAGSRNVRVHDVTFIILCKKGSTQQES